MKVKLKYIVRVPHINKYLYEGEVLEVIGEQGAYYICKNEEIECLFVQKGICSIIEKD